MTLIQLIPKLVQLPFLVLYDVCIYKITYRLFGYYPALFAYISNLSNYFLAYGLIRTNSNCFETFFLIYSLSVWNFVDPNSRGKERIYGIILSGITVLFRPTPIIYLILIYSYHFFITNTKLDFIILNLFPITAFLFLFQIISDSLFYSHTTFTLFNFFNFNIYSNNSVLYGELPFYWYFLVALPVMFGIYIILLPLILKYCNNLCIFYIAVISLIINSLFSHKEYRFIYYVIPLFTIYIGDVIYHLWVKFGNKIITNLLIITIMIHTVVFIFLSRYHQRGSLDVMEFLSEEVKDKPNTINVYILDTCHMTPFYSYIHKNITMSFPDCSPDNRKREGGSDTDKLIRNPLEFVNQIFDNDTDLPEYIVTTESKMNGIKSWFYEKGYKKVFFNKFYFHRYILNQK